MITPLAFRTRRNVGRRTDASSRSRLAARSPGSVPARICGAGTVEHDPRSRDGLWIVSATDELVHRGQVAQLHRR